MLDFELFDPAEMTGFVRELLYNDYQLQGWFPQVERQAIDYAFNRATRRREEIASFRGFDTPAQIGDRPGVARVHGEIPPMSKKLPITEWERLNLARQQGSTIADTELLALAYEDATLLADSIQARLEYARGTVLTSGQVTFVTDTGFTGVVVDYNDPAFGSVTKTTVANLWSDFTNADPISDLIAATQAWVIRNRGRQPGAVLITLQDLNNVVRCTKVRTLASVGGTIPSILTVSALNQLLEAYSVPPFVQYNCLVNVPGSGDTFVLPHGKAVMVPLPGDTVQFGETTMGVTAEALELIGKGYLTIDTAPGLVGVGHTEYDPVTKWTKVSALGLPVLKNPNLITVMTVA